MTVTARASMCTARPCVISTWSAWIVSTSGERMSPVASDSGGAMTGRGARGAAAVVAGLAFAPVAAGLAFAAVVVLAVAVFGFVPADVAVVAAFGVRAVDVLALRGFGGGASAGWSAMVIPRRRWSSPRPEDRCRASLSLPPSRRWCDQTRPTPVNGTSCILRRAELPLARHGACSGTASKGDDQWKNGSRRDRGRSRASRVS